MKKSLHLSISKACTKHKEKLAESLNHFCGSKYLNRKGLEEAAKSIEIVFGFAQLEYIMAKLYEHSHDINKLPIDALFEIFHYVETKEKGTEDKKNAENSKAQTPKESHRESDRSKHGAEKVDKTKEVSPSPIKKKEEEEDKEEEDDENYQGDGIYDDDDDGEDDEIPGNNEQEERYNDEFEGNAGKISDEDDQDEEKYEYLFPEKEDNDNEKITERGEDEEEDEDYKEDDFEEEETKQTKGVKQTKENKQTKVVKETKEVKTKVVMETKETKETKKTQDNQKSKPKEKEVAEEDDYGEEFFDDEPVQEEDRPNTRQRQVGRSSEEGDLRNMMESAKTNFTNTTQMSDPKSEYFQMEESGERAAAHRERENTNRDRLPLIAENNESQEEQIQQALKSEEDAEKKKAPRKKTSENYEEDYEPEFVDEEI